MNFKDFLDKWYIGIRDDFSKDWYDLEDSNFWELFKMDYNLDDKYRFFTRSSFMNFKMNEIDGEDEFTYNKFTTDIQLVNDYFEFKRPIYRKNIKNIS